MLDKYPNDSRYTNKSLAEHYCGYQTDVLQVIPTLYECPYLCYEGKCVDYIDSDNDGFNSTVDCDDNNASINPGADDSNCNGIDDDCNGVVDDNCELVPCTDSDGGLNYFENGIF